MRSFIILLLLIITLLISSLFELITVSEIIFWFISGVIAIYIGLVLFKSLLLIKVTGTQTTMTYVNSFAYCLLIAYYFFISDHKLSIYLACYLLFAYFVMCCVKYYKRHNKDEV